MPFLFSLWWWFLAWFLGPPRIGVDMYGGIISLFPSLEPLQKYLVVFLHTPFLEVFSSMVMTSFFVPLDLTKVVWAEIVLYSCPLNMRPLWLGLYWSIVEIQIPWPTFSLVLVIISHFPHELGTDDSSVIFKFSEGVSRKGLWRWVYHV